MTSAINAWPLGRRRRTRPRKLAGDKGYSSGSIRTWLRSNRIEPVIPHKDNEAARHDPGVKFDRNSYRRRCVIEHCVGWIKEFRRVGTRFDKLAVSFLAFVKLAVVARYLRLGFSDRT